MCAPLASNWVNIPVAETTSRTSPAGPKAALTDGGGPWGVGVGAGCGWGGGGSVGTVNPAENSEVLPTGSVAVAVTMRPLATGTLKVAVKVAAPLAFVVTLAKPRNCCPSAGRPSGSVLLAK